MMPRRFYCPQLAMGTISLPEDEAHHALHVMRLGVGAPVELFDGAGGIGTGVVEQCARREVLVRVDRVRNAPFELSRRLTLAVAMTKAHRQGYLVEKCTELGVAAIWPILTARSVTKPSEAAVDKWSRRAIEAAKQSCRAWVPSIAPVETFSQALQKAGKFQAAFFADRDESSAPVLRVLQAQNPVGQVIGFVGPEGGWTAEERQAARAAGMAYVLLSPTVLRAETAAVALCAAVAASSF